MGRKRKGGAAAKSGAGATGGDAIDGGAGAAPPMAPQTTENKMEGDDFSEGLPFHGESSPNLRTTLRESLAQERGGSRREEAANHLAADGAARRKRRQGEQQLVFVAPVPGADAIFLPRTTWSLRCAKALHHTLPAWAAARGTRTLKRSLEKLQELLVELDGREGCRAEIDRAMGELDERECLEAARLHNALASQIVPWLVREQRALLRFAHLLPGGRDAATAPELPLQPAEVVAGLPRSELWELQRGREALRELLAAGEAPPVEVYDKAREARDMAWARLFKIEDPTLGRDEGGEVSAWTHVWGAKAREVEAALDECRSQDTAAPGITLEGGWVADCPQGERLWRLWQVLQDPLMERLVELVGPRAAGYECESSDEWSADEEAEVLAAFAAVHVQDDEDGGDAPSPVVGRSCGVPAAEAERGVEPVVGVAVFNSDDAPPPTSTSCMGMAASGAGGFSSSDDDDTDHPSWDPDSGLMGYGDYGEPFGFDDVWDY
jgi:hypothetical protein